SGLASSFFFQAEDGIRDFHVTGVQTCALPILLANGACGEAERFSAKPEPRASTALAMAELHVPAAHTKPEQQAPTARAEHEPGRSEERRVGKESRCRWLQYS